MKAYRPLWSPTGAGDLSEVDFARLAQWVYRSAGVKLAAQKRSMAQARLTRRLRATGVASFAEYIELASRDPAESQWVVDLLTTHETRFFREREHFAFLQSTLLPKLKSGLRIWSAASSTGQEAYSLAMLLLAESRPEPWSIFGTDISEESIREAQEALYSMAVADQIPSPYLKRYCMRGTGPRAGTFRMGNAVRAHVRFRRSSLLAPDFESQFDLIFLKNVLIYFDEQSRRSALSNVWSRLACGGFLFLGAAETLRGTGIEAEHVAHGVYRKQC